MQDAWRAGGPGSRVERACAASIPLPLAAKGCTLSPTFSAVRYTRPPFFDIRTPSADCCTRFPTPTTAGDWAELKLDTRADGKSVKVDKDGKKVKANIWLSYLRSYEVGGGCLQHGGAGHRSGDAMCMKACGQDAAETGRRHGFGASKC